MAMPLLPSPSEPALPRFGWTVDRLHALPDDGRWHECVDGELFVSPTPRRAHHFVQMALYRQLEAYVTREAAGRVICAGGELQLDEQTLVIPDLFVEPPGIPRTAEWAEVPTPLLVVEILSPSTARLDRRVKRERYRRAGIPVYWIVDCDARLIEEWRADRTHPMITDAQLEWQAPGATAALTLDLPTLFRDALDTA